MSKGFDRALAPLFDGSLAPGVYRASTSAADLVARLEEAGWRTGSIVGPPTKADVLRQLGVALRFPAYYGHNLDALWDCLRDLSRPTAVVWSRWQAFAVDHPSDWAAIVELLRDRSVDEPAFALVLTAD